MGEVYRAVDTTLQRRVALKVLVSAGGQAEDQTRKAAARLLREARSAASFDHPNVVSVFDASEADGYVFIAMEYVSGEPLLSYLGSERVPVQRRLRWLFDVAIALGASHRAGLVHRDVKPANVMVREDGVVKVLDFGIAKDVDPTLAPDESAEDVTLTPDVATQADHVATLTGEGQIVGTPAYMAPEQLVGKPVDARTDQFAWGVLAYEVLCGDRPWDTSDVRQAYVAMHAGPPPGLVGRVPGLPAAVERAVLRAVSADSLDRFPSMEALALELEPYAERRSASSAQLETVQRAATGPQDLPTERLEELSGADALPAGAAPAAPRRRRLVLPAVAAVVVPLAVGLGLWLSGRSAPVVAASPEARAAYESALRLHRDGFPYQADQALQRALSLDGQLAAGHLRRSAIGIVESSLKGRLHYRKAHVLRDLLSDADRALVEAIDPFFRARADLPEVEARLARVVEAQAEDPFVRLLLGAVQLDLGRHTEAEATARATLGLDGAYVPARRLLAQARWRRGEVDGTLETLGECLEALPHAVSCLAMRARIRSRTGDCRGMEGDARAGIGVAPDNPQAHLSLASALLGRGAPTDSVAEALRIHLRLLPEAERRQRSPLHAYAEAVLRGDLEAADEALRTWDASLAEESAREARVQPAVYRASLLVEMGRPDEAAAVARQTLSRLEGWTENPLGRFHSSRMWFANLLYRTGHLSHGDLHARRSEWLAAVGDQLVGRQARDSHHIRWMVAYGTGATAEDATFALTQLPSSLRLPRDNERNPAFEKAVGRVYLAAGHPREARQWLELASRSCGAATAPRGAIRLAWLLGRAREETGDVTGALEAYTVVLRRWGSARPRSVTAEAARERVRAIEDHDR